jgi:hypothetical protein
VVEVESADITKERRAVKNVAENLYVSMEVHGRIVYHVMGLPFVNMVNAKDAVFYV